MDTIFKKSIEKQFEFDDEVASVFDDMLNRSIPLYEQSIDFVTTMISKLYTSQAIVTDLGCSTANTLLALYQKNHNYILYGFDNAHAMLKMAKKKANAFGVNLTLRKTDILEADIPKSDVIIANYVLQFIRPPKRTYLVEKIYNALNKNGSFVFSEKIIYKDSKFHKIMIDIYSEFKKTKGYSEFEIAQKRESLENVLIPYTEEENIQMIHKAGFKKVEILIKWGNFVTYLAVK